MMICLLGIIAGVSPSRCSRTHRHFKRNHYNRHEEKNQTENGETMIRVEGHHPSCENFSTHILSLGGKLYCTGCTGMVIGAIISLLASFLFLFAGFQIEVAETIFWLGFSGVAFGLLQLLFNLRNKISRLFLNIFFVLGAFFLLIGADEISGNFVLELYLLILIVYWIITRTLVSQWKHREVCSSCSLESCQFS